MNKEEICKNLIYIKNQINYNLLNFNRKKDEVKLIAVSKTFPSSMIKDAYDNGQIAFGENYVQELVSKNLELNNLKIEWHYIGHLQSNKVKYIAPFVYMIHGVDSAKLAQEINKQAEKNNRIIKCLIQVNTSGEMSKSGIEPSNVEELLSSIINLPNIKIEGLMTIPRYSQDISIIKQEFKQLFDILNKTNKNLNLELKELSMGMSSDFMYAIEFGATMVRIGSSIFGERSYEF